MKNDKRSLFFVLAVFLGVMIGLIIASNFDLTQTGRAGIESVESASAGLPSSPATASLSPAPSPESDLEKTGRAFVNIAKTVTPAVVAITSDKVVKVRNPFSDFFDNDDFFRRFFRTPNQREYRQQGLGSGVIVSADGYILTNFHVIRDADEINVLIDNDSHKAKIVGTDPGTDLAVIRIDKKNLSAISLGDSDKLEVGEWVLAIGSPFDERLQHTVTSGIVSAKGRSGLQLSADLTYQDFIQTDAAINPGNSGGALVNIKGELIGINTAILSGNAGGNVGIGFAIPVSMARRVMDDLISHGKVTRGYLGVYIQTPDDELSEALGLEQNRGAVIMEVEPGTPADKAGLKKLDVIIEVDGKEIENHQMLTNLVASYDPGRAIDLKVIRDGKTRYFSVKLQEKPSNNVDPEETTRDSDDNLISKLGLELTELTSRTARRFNLEGAEGVLVAGVESGSLAQEKGFRAGDLIKEVNRKKVGTPREVEKRLGVLGAGEIALFQIQRDSRNVFVAMRIPKS